MKEAKGRSVTHATERQLQMIHTCNMETALEIAPEFDTPAEIPFAQRTRKRSSRDTVTIRLCDLGVGETATIQDCEWQANNSALLESYGFFPGTAVTRVSCAPQGDPLIFRVDRSLVAVRRETAVNILIVREGK